MRPFLHFLFAVPLAFVLSCLTSAFSILWPYLGRGIGDDLLNPVVLVHSTFAFWAQSAQIGSALLVPWAVFMVVTEILRLSSIWLHMAAGIVGGVAIIIVAYGSNGPSASIQAAILVASLVFALTYWIFAGRNAGAWRPKRTVNRKAAAEPADHD